MNDRSPGPNEKLEKARAAYEAEPAIRPVYVCDDGTQIICTQGVKSGDDIIIKTLFPHRVQSHTLEYIGQALRIKGEVEEANYPSKKGYRGKGYLLDFLKACIYEMETPVLELCRIYKIPTRAGRGVANER